MKQVTSIVAGIFSLGIYWLVFNFLFDYLYFSFEVKPKVVFCRTFIEGDTCNLVAYISLSIMELPLVALTFFLSALIVSLVVKKGLILNSYLIAAGYMLSYICMVLLGPYGEGLWLYTAGLAFYQGVLFLGILWLVNHLTKRSTRIP